MYVYKYLRILYFIIFNLGFFFWDVFSLIWFDLFYVIIEKYIKYMCKYMQIRLSQKNSKEILMKLVDIFSVGYKKKWIFYKNELI